MGDIAYGNRKVEDCKNTDRRTEQRTRWNMRDADAILTVIPENSSESEGTNVGLEEGENLGKPMYTATGLADVPGIIQWINSLPQGVELCVGGPRASECSNAYDIAKAILYQVFEESRQSCMRGDCRR